MTIRCVYTLGAIIGWLVVRQVAVSCGLVGGCRGRLGRQEVFDVRTCQSFCQLVPLQVCGKGYHTIIILFGNPSTHLKDTLAETDRTLDGAVLGVELDPGL